MYSWLKPHLTHLYQLYQNNALPHAILFVAPKGCGKKQLAEQFCQMLFCSNSPIEDACNRCKACRLIETGAHPDFFYQPEAVKSIGVDVIRDVSLFVQKKAQLGQVKTVLLADVELMTESASNALLKTLEEPNNNCFIIMTCNDSTQLPATVISRCHLIALNLPSGEQLSSFVKYPQSVTPYSNINQIPELENEQINQEYNSALVMISQWLEEQTNTAEIEQLLINNEHGLRWFEMCVVNAMRDSVDRHKGDFRGMANPKESIYNKRVLSTIYQRLLCFSKTINNYNAANKGFLVNQLLFDLEEIAVRQGTE